MAPSNAIPLLPTVLLIDDDPISRDVLAMLLEIGGFPVTSAEDGPGALALLAISQPEVILMDTQMPGLSGIDLIKALRSRSTARIIAISGSEVAPAITAASDGFLLKPVNVDALVALLEAAEPIRKKRLDTPAKATGKAGPAKQSPESHADAPLIDPETLAKLKAMMPARSVREIYAAVASDLKVRLGALEGAMLAGDSPEVARIGHAIKGGCAMVGLSKAKEAASRLETSDIPRNWPTELMELRSALKGLEGMLMVDFPL